MALFRQNVIVGNPMRIQSASNPTLMAEVDADGNLAVDVTTLPDPHASRKTQLSVCGTEDSSGNTAIVAAPEAGQSHYVIAFVMQNEAATANTLYLSDGTTARFRVYCKNEGDGLAMTFPAGREWKVGDAKAITINLSAATAVGYSLEYYTSAA